MKKPTKSSKGIVIGIALNNIAIGVGIGVVFFAAFVSQSKNKN